MTLNCAIASAIDARWLNIPSRKVGPTPSHPTADTFILISEDGEPRQRIDVFFPLGAYNFATKAMLWQDWLLVGCCDVVHLVPLVGSDIQSIPMATCTASSDYFADFWAERDFLLIISGRGIIRIMPNGIVEWRQSGVGLDGVVVSSVSSSTIEGMGEWDPPGGWRPFILSTATGERL